MLIRNNKYKLSEFIIIEHGDILFTWVMHIALGVQRSGKCVIIGNILVLGHWDHEEAGFLKMEFHEQSMQLPTWYKTHYYCFATSLRKVGTEQNLTSDLIEHPYIPKIDIEAVNMNIFGTFRLGRYKITVDENNLIFWQTIGELSRIIGGKCVTESGILFIGPKEIESADGQSRRDFFAGQKPLPQWDKTFVWGHYGSLMKCKEPELRKSYAATWKSTNVKTRVSDNIPFYQNQQFRREDIRKFTASELECLGTTCYRFEWKTWSRLSPLIRGVVVIGFRSIMFIFGKLIHITKRIVGRFRTRL